MVSTLKPCKFVLHAKKQSENSALFHSYWFKPIRSHRNPSTFRGKPVRPKSDTRYKAQPSPQPPAQPPRKQRKRYWSRFLFLPQQTLLSHFIIRLVWKPCDWKPCEKIQKSLNLRGFPNKSTKKSILFSSMIIKKRALVNSNRVFFIKYSRIAPHVPLLFRKNGSCLLRAHSKAFCLFQ